MSSGAKSNKPFVVRREQRINYGERLLPRVLDDMAARNPDHIIALTPKSGTTLPLSFTSISSSQLANAVNVTSYLLDKLLTNNGYETKATIAFIGLQDFRYAVMELASMKTFHPLLLPSPRNALPNTASLIKDAGTKILFFTGAGTALEAQAQALQSLIPGLQIYSLSSLEEMATTKTKPYPYTALYSEIKDQKAIIVHTSGSTGDPKPIAYTHAYLARVDCEVLIPVPDGRIVGSLRLQRENEMNFFGGPFFHLSGVCIVSRAIFGNVSYVMGPIDRPLTGKIAYEIARSVEIRSILATPGVVDGLFGEFGEELKSLFRGLRFVCWFGGPLSHSTGNWIVQNLPQTLLWQIYGTTEASFFTVLVPPPSHWPYLEFHPLLSLTLTPTSDATNPNLYELIIHPNPSPSLSWSTPVFTLFPELNEWPTGDLFAQYPDPGFENLYLYDSRMDDLLLLNNALKVNPLHIETALQAHPLLNAALVIGEGKGFCGLLVEPKSWEEEEEEEEGLIEGVWGEVEEINRELPVHARVHREVVVVAKREKPFVRAGKGTVVRGQTVELYREEIEDVYRKRM